MTRRPDLQRTPAPVVHATHSRVAFSVWSFAFALAVLVHEWQLVVPLRSLHTVAGIAAITVLLRPAAVWRTAVLCGLLGIEFVSTLPNPFNYSVFTLLTAAGVAVSWVVLVLRSPQAARNPGAVYERIAPFLRVAFILTCFVGAFAKLNTGFLATVGTCAPRLINEIPVLRVPAYLHPATAVGMLAIELAIPTLLLCRRTRWLGIVIGLGFYALVAAGGNPSHAGLAWSVLLLFLPAATLARAAATAHTRLPRPLLRRLLAAARSPLALVVLGSTWLVALSVDELLPPSIAVRASRWSAMLLGLLWLLLWAWLLVKLRRHWVRNPNAPADLRVRGGVLLGALILLVANAASPYVGLKSDYSFEAYSNLRTEPGHWNHLVVPEAARVFGTQDGLVRFTEAQGPPRLVEVLEARAGELVVLTDARMLVRRYPDAQVRYELDGQPRFAFRVSDDPVLSEPLSPITTLLGRWRRLPLDGGCQV